MHSVAMRRFSGRFHPLPQSEVYKKVEEMVDNVPMGTSISQVLTTLPTIFTNIRRRPKLFTKSSAELTVPQNFLISFLRQKIINYLSSS